MRPLVVSIEAQESVVLFGPDKGGRFENEFAHRAPGRRNTQVAGNPTLVGGQYFVLLFHPFSPRLFVVERNAVNSETLNLRTGGPPAGPRLSQTPV